MIGIWEEPCKDKQLEDHRDAISARKPRPSFASQSISSDKLNYRVHNSFFVGLTSRIFRIPKMRNPKQGTTLETLRQDTKTPPPSPAKLYCAYPTSAVQTTRTFNLNPKT